MSRLVGSRLLSAIAALGFVVAMLAVTLTTSSASTVVFGKLWGVSCPSVTACTAVGSYVSGLPLSMRWNGTAWHIQPNLTTQATLEAVSCPTTSVCTAVGQSDPVHLPMAERWNGEAWHIQSIPNPLGITDGLLIAVSCPTASDCMAVGPSTSGSLAEHWDGTSWTPHLLPNPAGLINGVSCATVSDCTAVGNYYNGTTNVPLIEHWDGTSWTVQSTPNSPTNASLREVSCSTASSCTAVGTNFSPNVARTLAEHWDGTSWTVQSTPNPTGAGDSLLFGVSCSTANFCTAVGQYYISGKGLLSLAERWNGTAWRIQSTPNPTGSVNIGLTGVSCAAANACTAVGWVDSTVRPLVERWNGTAWHTQTTP